MHAVVAVVVIRERYYLSPVDRSRTRQNQRMVRRRRLGSRRSLFVDVRTGIAELQYYRAHVSIHHGRLRCTSNGYNAILIIPGPSCDQCHVHRSPHTYRLEPSSHGRDVQPQLEDARRLPRRFFDHARDVLSNPYLSSFPPPCSPTLFRTTSVPQSSANRRRRTFAP
ncbi:hypothetical protein M405DRAFT_619697 [Rhizopogon salebrosus TDB-379]|nr:hypothetical protein M405DRAFT_619697 [Rhizopogon salebrosus TDB-379]